MARPDLYGHGLSIQAPQSVRESFSDFLSKLQSSTRPGQHDDAPRPEVENAMSHGEIGEPDRHHATRSYGGRGAGAPTPKRDASVPAPDYDEFWEMPAKYWRCVLSALLRVLTGTGESRSRTRRCP